ncbi:glutamine amidotransferase [Corynebacterium sp. CCM 9185]|uniref:Glutamine amidotransferase n=1 Tax=Corynebacterium marambiense TaxID=2765364 RepID=A0ABS0VUP7_9CORY|nr:glutamine amidotransferase [Corynebacterium marambiense]MBI9000489.1 glutamine amidotransferase [Corynebacterium marambiense]MCK7664242.1 glutamine amidotransferase [Corynebacterium marambiense]MCX7543450.1 glutamine amidotransferase [Corynebacterium marambiense]
MAITEITKPFLLLSTRPEDDAAEAEYRSFVSMMELQPEYLIQKRVDREPLGPIVLDDYSGVIVGGGPYNATEPEKTDHQVRVETCLNTVIQECIERDFPLFGACYGVGIIGSVAGGVIDRHFGEKPGCIVVDVTTEGLADPILDGMPPQFPSIVGHKEATRALPPGATLLVRGEDCPVQMYRIKRHIYVTQFHPELELETFRDRLEVYREAGYYEPEQFESIIDSCSGHDLSTDNRLLWNFAHIYAR